MMKKIALMMVLLASAVSMQAQKFALVDMEYILRNIPLMSVPTSS